MLWLAAQTRHPRWTIMNGQISRATVSDASKSAGFQQTCYTWAFMATQTQWCHGRQVWTRIWTSAPRKRRRRRQTQQEKCSARTVMHGSLKEPSCCMRAFATETTWFANGAAEKCSKRIVRSCRNIGTAINATLSGTRRRMASARNTLPIVTRQKHASVPSSPHSRMRN